MTKEILLTIEKFSDGGEKKFLIKSLKEIQLTLHAVAQKKSSTLVYFDEGQQFIKSVLLAVTASGIWIDVGPSDEINNNLLRSDHLTVVTMHQGAKVQFDCLQGLMASYADHPAFYFSLPDEILRLQRRDYFRLATSIEAPLSCIISPLTASNKVPHEIVIMDISVGGIALSYKEHNVRLEAGATYQNCRIELPDIGTLIVAIKIKNLYEITSLGGIVHQHAGCEFIQLDANMSMLLQRYVGSMQSKSSGLR